MFFEKDLSNIQNNKYARLYYLLQTLLGRSPTHTLKRKKNKKRKRERARERNRVAQKVTI